MTRLLGFTYLLFVNFVLSVTVSSASEISVPRHWPTIQEAINAAHTGDEIVVQPGVYPENIDFLGKAVTVRSADPLSPAIVDSTIIDGGGVDTVVKFTHGEKAGSVIAGFTITNGMAASGGGVKCIGSSPTIANNHITSNAATYRGGGIYTRALDSPDGFLYSEPLVFGNLITCNKALVYWGGAIYSDLSKPVITNNVILSNEAVDGGGLCLWSCPSAIVASNTLTENTATISGAGIFCYSSYGTITDNMIVHNIGHGIYSTSMVSVLRNTILQNTLAGVQCQFRESVENNQILDSRHAGIVSESGHGSSIIGNLIRGRDSGIICRETSALIANNTLTWLTVGTKSTVMMDNCVLAGFDPSHKYRIWLESDYESMPARLIVRNSNIEGKADQVYVGRNASI
ncbi:MAG TPA: right-handed parallel beta-helix repeat-containing protein, partial [Phycisphaerae bacterium]|nr:right-handed parallel beta-helix repeat-containing protein [Phycisphaerae bacterium]